MMWKRDVTLIMMGFLVSSPIAVVSRLDIMLDIMCMLVLSRLNDLQLNILRDDVQFSLWRTKILD